MDSPEFHDMSDYSLFVLIFFKIHVTMKKKSKISVRKPIQRRSQETRNSILEAATHILLSKSSLAGFNSNAIAARAGVSIGSFYQYYPNKEAVLEELIEGRMASFVETLNKTLISKSSRDERSPRAFLHQLLLLLLNEFRKDPLLTLLMFEFSHLVANRERMKKAEELLIPILSHTLRTSIPNPRKNNPELASFVMLQAYRGVVAIASSRKFLGIDLDVLAEELTDLFWRYLSKSD